MVDMALHQILPAALRYTHSLCGGVGAKRELGASYRAENALVKALSSHTDQLYDAIETLRFDLKAVPSQSESAASYYHDVVIPAMEAIRKEADTLETLTDKSCWPYPTYSDLLFY